MSQDMTAGSVHPGAGAPQSAASTHFERLAQAYAGARPAYPPVVYDTLRRAGVLVPGTRVLEIGAGTGEATADLVAAGCEVTAIEPGPRLARLLADRLPGIRILTERIEDARLPDAAFDVVAAATSLHWVDLAAVLPRLHRTLRRDGFLAVWRTTYGDASVTTPFRRRVHEIVARRDPAINRSSDVRGLRPTMRELAADGHFVPVDSWEWPWSVQLTSEQVGRLFATFSEWTPDEVDQVRAATDDLGGSVVEHYRTLLHLLERAPVPPASGDDES